MHAPWDLIETFVAVLEHGSFSAAALALGVGQPTVSRRIAQLEEQIGDRLFERARVGALPTAAAERLRAPARGMAASAQALHHAAESAPRLDGAVHIAAPPGWAYDFLADAALAVRLRHPGIRLQVLSGVRHVDLAAGEADLAIRMRAPTEHALMPLAESDVVTGAFAAPRYLERTAPDAQLADLDWICWAHPFTRLEPRGLLERLIDGFEPAFASDSYLVMMRAARAGVGAVVSSRLGAQLYDLVPIPQAFPSVTLTMHVVAVRSAWRNPSVRAAGEAILDELSARASTLGVVLRRS